jgi:hypothetical protein
MLGSDSNGHRSPLIFGHHWFQANEFFYVRHGNPEPRTRLQRAITLANCKYCVFVTEVLKDMLRKYAVPIFTARSCNQD